MHQGHNFKKFIRDIETIYPCRHLDHPPNHVDVVSEGYLLLVDGIGHVEKINQATLTKPPKYPPYQTTTSSTLHYAPFPLKTTSSELNVLLPTFLKMKERTQAKRGVIDSEKKNVFSKQGCTKK
ncbi:hypothetical protein JTE90_023124 [Oedothorax gibbosus]|uniref:Uncharacterized protein n=1 Tax=Oedothorax gibbosus TaxID=931172 RepID=A0AAV6UNU2_9ARAC|nr:hypothetical protein JTE90_023124 [Oedothorax gibbosus]